MNKLMIAALATLIAAQAFAAPGAPKTTKPKSTSTGKAEAVKTLETARASNQRAAMVTSEADAIMKAVGFKLGLKQSSVESMLKSDIQKAAFDSIRTKYSSLKDIKDIPARKIAREMLDVELKLLASESKGEVNLPFAQEGFTNYTKETNRRLNEYTPEQRQKSHEANKMALELIEGGMSKQDAIVEAIHKVTGKSKDEVAKWLRDNCGKA